MRHVDDGRLHAYLDGQLEQVEPGGVEAVERHLAGCDACRARLAHARGVRGQADSILAGMLPARLGEVTPEPAFRPGAVPARPARRVRPWIPMAWAASILLAVTAGWLARRPGGEQEAMRETVEFSLPVPAEAPEREAPAVAAATAPAETAAAGAAAPGSTSRRAPALASAEESGRAEDFAGTGRAGGVADRAEEQVAMSVAAAPPPPPPPVPAAIPPPSAADVGRVAYADSLVLKGQVTDRTGQGIAGAQVRAPGMGASTVTRADGSYALSIPTSRLQGRDTVAVRVVRPGMDAQTRTLALGRADTLDFALRPSAVALESVLAPEDAARGRVGAKSAAPPPAAARAERRPGEWEAVERADAERVLGQRVLLVPDLPVLGMEVGDVLGQPVVRVRQGLEGGKVLSILLQRDSGAPASAAVELERERRGGVTVRQGSLIILLSGPITRESLASYGRRLRP